MLRKRRGYSGKVVYTQVSTHDLMQLLDLVGGSLVKIRCMHDYSNMF